MGSVSALVIALSILASNIAAADGRAAVNQSSPPKHASNAVTGKHIAAREAARPARVSCEDMMAFDQAASPRVVYFKDGRKHCKMTK